METKGKHIKNDEIDDFAKALLDKKTEIALEDIALKENERIVRVRFQDTSLDDEIGASAFDALNLLRKERGQDPITPENVSEVPEIAKPVEEPIPEWEEEDFTTSSLSRENIMKQSMRSVQRVIKETEAQTAATQTASSEPVQGVPEKQTEKAIVPEAEMKTPARKPKEPKKQRKSISFKELSKQQMYILIAVVLGLLVIVGYGYRELIWVPQNIPNAQQEKAYDKLVAYADEYTMMSPSEKYELLDMEEDYNILLSKQKSEINNYFEEQVDRTYTELLQDLKQSKQTEEDLANPDYQTLAAALTNWATKTTAEKYAVIDLYDTYENSSKSIKKKIDNLAKTETGKDFVDLVETLKKQRDSQSHSQETEAKIAQLQAEIATLQAELDSFIQYGETLTDESLIQTNNETIASYQAQIEALQAQIDAMQPAPPEEEEVYE